MRRVHFLAKMFEWSALLTEIDRAPEIQPLSRRPSVGSSRSQARRTHHARCPGNHVAKIQYALGVIAGEPLDIDGQYGPKTAAAVLSFKQKWNIINPTYQTQPDEIVGIMTIATLDEQMVSIENSGGGGRLITCTYRKAPGNS